MPRRRCCWQTRGRVGIGVASISGRRRRLLIEVEATMGNFEQKSERTPPAASVKTVTPDSYRKPVCDLQNMIGNRAVFRMRHDSGLSSPIPLTTQPKSNVNTPGDDFEEEADLVAEGVAGAGRLAAPAANHLSAQATMPLKRSGSLSQLPAGASPVVQHRLSSPGRPLDASTRAFMEPRMGFDLSHVRVHTDAAAAASAHAMRAKAFTTGAEIVFGAGQYRPETTAGRQLLAHELAHVVQQQGGPAVVQRKE